MSFELVNTLSTLGTFLVIAATAIVAIVQLRHARSSNQIEVFNELRETEASEEIRGARHFVARDLAQKLRDSAFRYQVNANAARTDENRPLIGKIMALGNFYEGMGLLVKAGFIDSILALEMYAEEVAHDWEELEPITAISRRQSGKALWENFEYVTVLAQDWIAAHPKGAYPAGVRRIDLKDDFLEPDKRYAASLPSP